MGLKSGLFIPNTAGIRTGLGTNDYTRYPAAAGATLLHTIDWTPATFSKTQGAGSLDPNSTAAHHWNCNEASGNLDDAIGGATHDLVAQGSDIIYQQAAVGLCDGTNLTGIYCLETNNAAGYNDRFLGATSTLAPSANSVGVRFVMRCFQAPGSQLYVWVKRDGSAADWFYLAINTSGQLVLSVDDGTTEVKITGGDNVCDGAWHVVEAIVDWTANLLKLRTDLGAETSLSISTLTQANVAGSGQFGLWGGGASNAPVRGMQIADLWGWTGTAAENLSSDAISDFWVHGADPQAGTIFEDDSISYTGVVYAPASEDTFAPYSGDSSQYPIGYSTRLTDVGAPNGFGRFGRRTTYTQAITESERLENWTASGITVSATAADMVDNVAGFRQARKLTDTGSGGGYIYSNTMDGSTGNFSSSQVFVKSASGTVDIEWIMWDEVAGSAVWTEAASIGTSGWTRVGKYANDVNNNLHMRIKIVTASGAIYACGAQLLVTQAGISTGPSLGVYAPSFGASTTITSTYGFATYGGGSEPDFADEGYIDRYALKLKDDSRSYSGSPMNIWRFTVPSVGDIILNIQTPTNAFWLTLSGSNSSTNTGLTSEGELGLRCQGSWGKDLSTFGGDDAKIVITDPSGSQNITMTPATYNAGLPSGEYLAGQSAYTEILLGYTQIYTGVKTDL